MNRAWRGLPSGLTSYDYSKGWNEHDQKDLSGAGCEFPLALRREDWVKAREHYNIMRRLVLKYWAKEAK